MKKARKLITFILAAVMVLSMSMNVWAVDITITNGATGSEYAAYKLLNATASEDKYAYTLNDAYEDILIEAIETVSNDDDVTSEEIIPYIQGLSGEENKDKLRKFANAVYAGIKESGLAADVTTATDSNTFSDVAQGYYLIAETEIGDWGENESDDTYSLVMLDTAVADADGIIEIQTKEERPTLTKKIIKDDYAEGNDYAEGVVENNLGIGSKVQFELKATIPSDANQYDSYYCIFSDKLSPGLTFDAATLTVTQDGNNLDADDYVVYTGNDADGNTFQVALKDAKSLAGKEIKVTYWAELNENAEIVDSTSNTNTAKLTYSNDPNTQYGDDTDEKPGKPDDPTVPMGETPELVTKTYTTGIKLLKTDGTAPLTGAEFQITGTSLVNVIVSGDAFVETNPGDGTYYKLKNGTYTQDAPNGNESEYDSLTKNYNKVTGPTKMGENEQIVNVKAFVDTNGVLTFTGLGEGIYTITETTVPAGYNKAKDIEVKIEWNEGEGDKWTVSYKNVGDAEYSPLTDEDSDNLFDLTVVNNTGSELPSTGGIGTTIFYIVGGALVLFAVVLLVTKKRMKDNQ